MWKTSVTCTTICSQIDRGIPFSVYPSSAPHPGRYTVRPHLEYCSTAWSTTPKTNQQARPTTWHSDHWCDAVHTDHRNGESHRSPTSRSKEGRQDYDVGRQLQVHVKPSHENQVGGSHQEPVEKEQFCA